MRKVLVESGFVDMLDVEEVRMMMMMMRRENSGYGWEMLGCFIFCLGQLIGMGL